MTSSDTKHPQVGPDEGGGKPYQAFPRGHRLLSPWDFARVFSDAVRSSDRYFTVLARPTETGVFGPRLGLAIAKKQLRHAVQRNRIKRLVREYFRTEVIPGSGQTLDYVVMARAAVQQECNRRLRRSLACHFDRLRKQVCSEHDTGRPVP